MVFGHVEVILSFKVVDNKQIVLLNKVVINFLVVKKHSLLKGTKNSTSIAINNASERSKAFTFAKTNFTSI